MRFVYPAQLTQSSENWMTVSFRDIPSCHTSGGTVAEALVRAEDALGDAIAGVIGDDETIPIPSAARPGEHMVSVPAGTAAQAALTLAFRSSGLTRVEVSNRLGVHDRVVRRMLDPRHGTPVGRIGDALRVLGHRLMIEVEGRATIAETPSLTEPSSHEVIYQGLVDDGHPVGVDVRLETSVYPLPYDLAYYQKKYKAGLSWGHHGAGPGRLARMLLLHATESKTYADAQSGRFKRDVVAKLPPDQPWSMRRSAILAWAEAHPIEAKEST